METKTAATIVKNENTERRRISRHVQFTLCGSCFWSASYLDARDVGECPSCKSGKVESMPVAGNEMYMFDLGTLRGVTVHFIPIKSRV